MRFFRSLKGKKAESNKPKENTFLVTSIPPPPKVPQIAPRGSAQSRQAPRSSNNNTISLQPVLSPPSADARGTDSVSSSRFGDSHTSYVTIVEDNHEQQQQQQLLQPQLKRPPQEQARSSNDMTRDLVKRFVAEIWNNGNLDMIPQLCSRSLRINGPIGMDRVGHDGFARMVTIIRDGLADYHCEIHSMVVEGNKAFCRLRFTGRHSNPLLGYPPTGKRVAWMGAAEITTKDNLILKVWELGDLKSLEKQLKGAP